MKNIEKESSNAEQTRCGFVALIGAPNAGKSTLINKLVGEKVSIVSRKVQTTRTRVCGIVMEKNTQIIFVDTPGIFAPKKRLDRAMVSSAWTGAGESDIKVLIVDVQPGKITAQVLAIIEKLKETDSKAILCLNKIDEIDKETLLPLADKFFETGVFTDVLMISALHGHGIDKLREIVSERLPLGPWLYPEDQISDMPMRLLAAEITREKVFSLVHQEIPYSVTVETEQWEETEKGATVSQTIYVGKEGHKSIVIGKQGAKIKAIGMAARKEMERLYDMRIRLELFVKVRENWMEDPERYRVWGLSFDS